MKIVNLVTIALLAGQVFAVHSDYEIRFDNNGQMIATSSSTNAIVPASISMDNFSGDFEVIRKLLPNDVATGVICQVKRKGIASVNDEDQMFSAMYELKLESVTNTDNHRHYYTGEQVATGINDTVVKYPVHECSVTNTIEQIVARLSGSSDDTAWFVLAARSTDGGHVKGVRVLESDGTPMQLTMNRLLQDSITPDPAGVGEPVVRDAVGTLKTIGQKTEVAVRQRLKKWGLR